MKHFYLSQLLIILTIKLIAQPTDNPYKTKYGTNGYHWTDSLKWNTIFNVTAYGATANDTTDDLTAINAAISAANTAGGGVVYFPAGTYKISQTLKLKSGVILRGADFSNNNAKQSDFAPASKLEFPKYNPVFSGSGTPITTGFRAITSETKEINNIAIVNLDINRARIEFHPSFVLINMLGGQGTEANYQPVEHNRNCLVMGIRSNNTAIPAPDVPGTGQYAWQRFSWRFGANIDLYFAENVIVANCRLNDLSYNRMDDSFDQPGYITVTSDGNKIVTPDSLTRFNYAAHYGISVNRAKMMGEVDNKTISIQPFIWYCDPEQEPSLFARGIEIRDNWIYKELRIAITASGLGLLIKDNIAKDKPNKIAYLTPNGQKKNTNYSATYENRGIDFAGWDVRIEGNDVEAFHLGWPGTTYKSIDGEGIMNQGNSGGTNVNGLVMINNVVNSISPNKTNPAFSCYSMEEVFNVVCKHNTISGLNGYFYFGATKAAKILHNVIVDSNGVGSISMDGTGGGTNNFCRYNYRIGSDYGQSNDGKISATCNVIVEDNDASLIFNGCSNPAGTIPDVAIINPLSDTTISNTIFTVNAVTSEIVDSVIFYNGAVKMPKIIPTNTLVQQPFSLNYNMNYISAKAYKNGLFNYSPIRKINVSPVLTKINNTPQKLSIAVYPNPFNNEINVLSSAQIKSIKIINSLGVIISSNQNCKSLKLNTSTLPAGLYIVIIKLDDNRTFNYKMIK